MVDPGLTSGTALVIDTAAPVAGVGVVRGGELAWGWSRRLERGLDGELGPALQDALGRAPRLDVVAVVTGPGAFTGLRVGVAAGLGVAVAMDLPVAGVGSLEARAAGLHGRVLSLLDARKGRVYAAWYEVHGEAPRVMVEPCDVPLDVALAGVEPGFCAVGEGALAFRNLIESAGGVVADAAAAPPLLQIGLQALSNRDAWVPPEGLRLHYVRPPDARPPRAGGGRLD